MLLRRAFLPTALCTILFVASGSLSRLSAQSAAAAPGLPAMRFASNLPNNALASSLGTRLEAVAAHHGQTASTFRQLISRDKCLCADQDAHLFYACEAPVIPAAANTAANSLAPAETNTAKINLAAATLPPVLHSRVSSLKKIFLDFNGHKTSGTSWNSSFARGAIITTPAFDLDGQPDTFSDAETARIQAIWSRVAEDFAPFDVDVTTEDPGAAALSRTGSGDSTYGIRVCIGGSCFDWYGTSAGGVAYLGSFIWSTDTPCFIFTSQLSSGAEKFTAEAISHEVGHTLGLNHDGVTGGTEYYQGHGNWAPIMGVGYYRDVTQWSKGDYAKANNTQDDIAVMASYGATPIVDDHGDAQSSATVLTGNAVTASGLITTRADADLFRFVTGAGPVNFNVSPASLGPNLDIQLALYNNSGVLVTSTNPSSLASTLSTTLTAGTYYLSIDGTGTGDASTGYNDYASIGAYTLAGTIIPPSGQAPVAKASATPATTGIAPLTVAFSSVGSYDPDGSITSYRWDFGDGSPVETVANPVHVYTKTGSYTASLVVRDNSAFTATATLPVTVSTTLVKMSVTSIGFVTTTTKAGTSIMSYVSVKDSRGQPVAGATVNATWSGAFNAKVSAVTNTLGLVAFVSPRLPSQSSETLTITGLSKTGLLYDATLNVVTSRTVTLP